MKKMKDKIKNRGRITAYSVLAFGILLGIFEGVLGKYYKVVLIGGDHTAYKVLKNGFVVIFDNKNVIEQIRLGQRR